jgi:hypothetical protein
VNAIDRLLVILLITIAMTGVVIAGILWTIAQDQIRNGAAEPATSLGMIRLARTTARGQRLYRIMLVVQTVCAALLFYLVFRSW